VGLNPLNASYVEHPVARPGQKACRALLLSVVSALTAVIAEEPDSTPTSPHEVDSFKSMSLEELMNQEVTSVSRRPQSLTKTASAIQVINQDDIRRSGATSLPEILRMASNLQVAQIDSRNWAISARGFNSSLANKMLVMIDGRAVYTPLFAGVFWDVQETFLPDIERIEVISGPGATAWGANAVNGVISVNSKSAKETQGWLVQGGGGTEARGFGGVRYGGEAASNLHYRVYGKYMARDASVLPSGDDAGDELAFGQGGMRADWDVTGKDLVTLQGDIYKGEFEQLGPEQTDVNGGNAQVRLAHTISDNSDVAVKFYYDRTHRDIPASITEDLDTYDADFQHRFPVGSRNDVVWGFGYRVYEDSITNVPTVGFLPAHVVHDVISGFAQDEIALIPDELMWMLGTKLERNDYTEFEVQPSTRLAWHFAAQQTLWGAVSRAVRTPSRVDRDLYAPSTEPHALLQGGPSFDAEKLWAYELGYRAQPHELVAGTLSLFYNDYDDLRSLQQISPPAPFPLEIINGFTGESYGAELTIEVQAREWWRLAAGYTEMRVHIMPKPGTTDTSAGAAESHDSEHLYLLRSLMDLPYRLRFDATLRAVAGIANQSVPSYEELDLRLGWMAKDNLEISLVGQNLLHDQHAEFGTPAQRREIERSAYAKVLWEF
jgi:iron complex outermembrane recepter protein